MNPLNYFSKFKRFQQLVLTTFLSDVPTIFGGVKLRNLLYRTIFPQIGSSVYIQDGVEFISTDAIKIGNGVYIFKGARIDGKGHESNRIHLENGVILERNVIIGALNNTFIHIGQDTFIGPSVSIMGPGDIKIGKHCLIAAHTAMYANNHNFADLTEPIKYQGITCKGIVIEDDCWLGHGVKVLDGVTIGRGSVIGAGAVVTKDIPPFSVAVGIPARVIKSRDGKELVQSTELPMSSSN
jgi:acetyltransferase-like isoleucine patch superfamily enzyme